MMRVARWRAAAGAVALAALLAGCGADGSDDAAASDAPASDAGAGTDATDVASDAEPAEMPDLSGLTEDEARAALADLGVDDGDIQVDEAESMEDPGTVIGQVPRAGSTITGSVNITVAEAIREVPDFVGGDIGEVRSWARDRGIEVVEVEVLDEEAASGEVLATTPAAGERPSSEIEVEVAVAPETSALINREPTLEDCSYGLVTGEAPLDGDPTPDSLLLSASVYAGRDCVLEYSLGRDFVELRAIIGLSDDSPSAARMAVKIFGDGRELFNETVTLAEARAVKLDVTDVLNLRIQTSTLVDVPTAPTVVIGDATLVVAPGTDLSDTTTTSTP